MTDMKNVNNWHWVNKDCRPWAKTYLSQQLIGISATGSDTRVSITRLDECIGDVDLNQRKGKLLAIYDMELKLSWQANLADGSTVFGTIQVPEVAYDTELGDYVFNIKFNGSEMDEVKALIRSDLTPRLRTEFSKFTQALIDNHSADLYTDKTKAPISSSSSSGSINSNTASPSSTTARKRMPSPQVAAKSTATPAQATVKTSVIEHTYDFKGVNARDIYEALLDEKRATIWSKGKAKTSKRIGSDFEFFGGNVHGTLLQAMPAKSIMQTWRLKSWPKDHYSTVTLSFIENQDGVTVNVSQVGVPVGQEEVIRRNWMGYYWTAIKESLNKGQLQDLPIQQEPLFGLFDQKYMVWSAILVALLLAVVAYSVAPKL